MPGRFAAFSFVDGISCLEPGARARGHYTVPTALGCFPSCLLAEAVGQLAAWVAMSTVDFQRRPLAGLAGETRFHGTATPGQTVELAVELEGGGEDAVAYAGAARVGRTLILELARYVGPMLPTVEFDAPEALRADLELLRHEGAAPGRFDAIPDADVRVEASAPGAWITAELRVPPAAPFFTDHFPRRPVLPGALLLEAQLALARRLAGEVLGVARPDPVPARVTDVKLRSFISPGAVVTLRVDTLARTARTVTVGLRASVAGRPVATGRAELVAPRAA
jgi:3-hydroxymyristoyl/3-hydroxydecanoyl-(acyl carrier protein) dehydratase